VKFFETDKHLSFLPLAHVFEKIMFFNVLNAGAEIGFYGGDPLKLKEDIARYCPTVFASVPRVYNKFYDAIKTGTNSLEGIKKSLVDFGVSSKLENLHKNADYKSSIWDTLVFNKIKQAFGG
jgi:long-chain acyl-CoA synthetase